MTPQLSSVTMTTRTRRGFLGFSVFILLLDFPLPSLGLPSPQGFCVGQGCLGNPGAGLGIRNPGRNIPIRINTPRIGNPASGLNFNFGGRDYGSSLEITDKKKSNQDEEAVGHFFLIRIKSEEDN